MTEDKDLMPLIKSKDDLGELSGWLARRLDVENVIVITTNPDRTDYGFRGDLYEMLEGLNYTIYGLIKELDDNEEN